MFTGIVEELGTVVSLERRDEAVWLTVRGPLVAADLAYGDSVAVNGCCLTVTSYGGDEFTVDVMAETLDKTSLGRLEPGSPVNLERALPVQARLGGHIVQGHVDGTGTIVERYAAQHWDVLRISLPADLARYVAVKGSVTVDGVSLTVVDIDDHQPSFTVSLIPTTLQLTTLGRKDAGDPVNLEVDVLAKYVERLVRAGEAS